MKQQPTTDTTPARAEPPANANDTPVNPCVVDLAAATDKLVAATSLANRLLDGIKLALTRAPYDELKAPLHTLRREAGAFLGRDEK